MIKPYSVNVGKNVVLTQWPVGTDDEHVLLRSEDLLTVCAHSELVITSYLRKTGLTLKELNTPAPEPEEEQETVEPVALPPEDSSYDEDDIEPA